MTKLITLISLPRSGTEFVLHNILKKFTQICVCLELFNPNKDIVKNAFPDKYTTQYREDKEDFLTELIKRCDEEYLIFKVFDSHVTGDELKRLIKRSHAVIFLTRNYVDQYISMKKGHLTGRNMFFDHTNVKIQFDVTDFKDCCKIYNDFFSIAKEEVNISQTPHTTLEYEVITSIRSEEEQVHYCHNVLNNLLGRSLILNMKDKHFKVTKQDNSTRYEDKIENYDEVRNIVTNRPMYSSTADPGGILRGLSALTSSSGDETPNEDHRKPSL